MTTSRTSALLVISSSDRRGAEVFATVLGKELSARGIEADLLALDAAPRGSLDVPVAGAGRWRPGTFARLIRAVREHDVVVANGGTTLIPTMLAATVARRPFVYRNIGDPTVWGAARLAGLRIGLPLRRAAAVAALYPDAAAEITRRYRVRATSITVIPNAASAAEFTPATPDERARVRAELHLDDRRWVGFVGSLSEEKRPLAAIEAVRGDDRLGLLVAGDGPLSDACHQAAGDDGSIRFLGNIDNVADVYRAVDVVVIPSRTEGLPGAAIEAGLSGVPVVATDVGGLSHVVHPDTGILVDPGADPATLGDALAEAAARRDELGAAAAARCRSLFEIGGVADQWGDLLRRVAAPRRSPASLRRIDAHRRVLDLLVLGIVAVPVSIVGAVCALAVRLTSSGPVLFRQERAGKDGEPFVVLKFRTMIDEPNPIFPDASRITSAGRILRRLSLDELPQLINVARGEMSVVGPRPTLPYQVERYDVHQRRRLEVRPGLTGLAQVSGRNALSWADRIDLDVRYVDQRSVALDLRIIGRTAKALIGGEGVEGHPTDDPLASHDDGTP